MYKYVLEKKRYTYDECFKLSSWLKQSYDIDTFWTMLLIDYEGSTKTYRNLVDLLQLYADKHNVCPLPPLNFKIRLNLYMNKPDCEK